MYLPGITLFLRASVCLFSLAAAASAVTITFDAGDPINGLGVGAVLSNQYQASTGASFFANAFSG